jgi:squalene cyclase
MEMPISNAPDPGQWTEDIYTTWKSPYQKFEQEHLKITKTEDKNDAGNANANKMTGDDGSFSDGSRYSDDRSFTESEGSYDDDEESYSGSEGSGSFSHADDETEASWEDAPECGEIINMRLKIGEHITRVHPDFTSSLRSSRWRKKYFPNGTFPY